MKIACYNCFTIHIIAIFKAPFLSLKTKIYIIFIFGIKLISEFPIFHLTIFHFDVIKQRGPNITELFEFMFGNKT